MRNGIEKIRRKWRRNLNEDIIFTLVLSKPIPMFFRKINFKTQVKSLMTIMSVHLFTCQIEKIEWFHSI